MPIETVSGSSLNYYLVTFDAAGNERDDDPDGPMSQKILDALSSSNSHFETSVRHFSERQI